MLPIKNILCPTDFSDPSYEALKAADELAVHFGATLHIVNVVPLVPIVEAPIGVESASFNVASYQQELEGQAQKSLKNLAEQKISQGRDCGNGGADRQCRRRGHALCRRKGSRHDCYRHPRAIRLAQVYLGVHHRADRPPGLMPCSYHTQAGG